MKFATIIFALLLITSCSKKEDLASSDSLLVSPHTEPEAAHLKQDFKSGLVIDSTVTIQQPEIDTLKDLDPVHVVEIYDAYRPLRNDRTTQAQLDSFLQKQKITEHQLHAVLVEGDRLGWAGAKSH